MESRHCLRRLTVTGSAHDPCRFATRLRPPKADMGSAAFVPVSAWLPCVAVFALKRLPQRSKLFVDPVNDPLIEQRSVLHLGVAVGAFRGGEVQQCFRAA